MVCQRAAAQGPALAPISLSVTATDSGEKEGTAARRIEEKSLKRI